MKFVGMRVKGLPFPHFHEPISQSLLVFIYHPFFIKPLTPLKMNILSQKALVLQKNFQTQGLRISMGQNSNSLTLMLLEI